MSVIPVKHRSTTTCAAAAESAAIFWASLVASSWGYRAPQSAQPSRQRPSMLWWQPACCAGHSVWWPFDVLKPLQCHAQKNSGVNMTLSSTKDVAASLKRGHQNWSVSIAMLGWSGAWGQWATLRITWSTQTLDLNKDLDPNKLRIVS